MKYPEVVRLVERAMRSTGLGRHELADEIGVHVRSVDWWKAGDTQPRARDVHTLTLLAREKKQRRRNRNGNLTSPRVAARVKKKRK